MNANVHVCVSTTQAYQLFHDAEPVILFYAWRHGVMTALMFHGHSEPHVLSAMPVKVTCTSVVS